MKYCVFLDIDGTLIEFGKKDINEETKLDLKKAQANGVLCLINTGRPNSSLPQEIMDFGFDGYCCACGGCIQLQGKEIMHEPLGEEGVRFLEDLAMNHGVHITFEGYEYNYGYENDAFMRKHYKNASESFAKAMHFGPLPMSEDARRQILKATLIDFDKNESWIKQASQNYNFMIQDSYDGTNTYSGELVPKFHSKAKAMDIVKHFLNDDIKTIAIGDGVNDIEMLENADISFWMENGAKCVQPYATYVAEKVENNGVGKALRKLNLIK